MEKGEVFDTFNQTILDFRALKFHVLPITPLFPGVPMAQWSPGAAAMVRRRPTS